MSRTAPRLKICGLTSAEDAEAAIQAGANLLGLIFVPNTARTIQAEALKQITELAQFRAGLVGVFQDQPLALVQELASRLPFQLVQLHGNESPEYCQAVGKPIIKSFELKSQLNFELINTYQNAIQHALLDWPKGCKAPVPWGSFPDTLLETLAWGKPFLAGKLKAESVSGLIKRFKPYGVDVASGVENEAGRKDAHLMQAFVQAVKPSEIEA
jgi:phosphoribosylanthranilate isomerase